jgi:hypothetical protein
VDRKDNMKIIELSERLQSQEFSRFYVSSFSPLSKSKHLHLLPEIYKEFYRKIGTVCVGSDREPGCGFFIVSIITPNFWQDFSEEEGYRGFIWGLNPEKDEMFNDNSFLKDVLFLGYDVDLEWFGYDLTKKVFVTINNYCKDCINIVDYFDYLISRY